MTMEDIHITKRRVRLWVFMMLFVTLFTACVCKSSSGLTIEHTKPCQTVLHTSDSVVVYIQGYSTNNAVIVSQSLTREVTYAEISVDSKAKLLSPIRTDREGNLYFAYRSKDEFFVRLSPTGEVDQVVLPRIWAPQSIWLGDTLVLDSNGSEELVMVNTEMQVDSAPALSMGYDGEAESGVLGTSSGEKPFVLWVATYPIRRDGGLYAKYLTFDPMSKQMEENFLPILNTKTDDLSESDILTDRIHTVVYAVEPENGYTLLCFGINSDESDYRGAYLELYDSAHAEPVMTEQACCSNNVFRFAGGYFLTDRYYEGCSHNWIRRLRDGSKVIALEEFENDDELIWNQIVSNGDSFIYINNKKAYYIDQQGKVTGEYTIDFEGFPNCWGSEECFGFSQPFYPKNETVSP